MTRIYKQKVISRKADILLPGRIKPDEFISARGYGVNYTRPCVLSRYTQIHTEARSSNARGESRVQRRSIPTIYETEIKSIGGFRGLDISRRHDGKKEEGGKRKNTMDNCRGWQAEEYLFAEARFARGERREGEKERK